MSDCGDGEAGKIFWLADDGTFHEVSVASQASPIRAGELDELYAENPTIVYSWEVALMANGQVVGSARFTDH
ncbi:hypothetical protein [Thioalkalivibrio thiocyanodenitrificans]|uniref:hypothetical protein n=1 Tax=Thioalkalivibrio thiocyanodenitrificans TaxID=243063 RepID=UPI00037E4A01|nr:hypothetical protein [Thioalkalivibrio thiocyanodenitrificans]